MQELRQAIYTKALGCSSLWTAIGGRLYFDNAPQDVIFPYVVFSKVTGVAEYTFTSKEENTNYQFTIFSSTAGVTEIEEIYGYLVTCFDIADITLANDWGTILCFREFDNVQLVGNVWHWWIRYRILISKNR